MVRAELQEPGRSQTAVSPDSGDHEIFVRSAPVPVGLTGWAQVHGLRGDTSIVDRAAFDNYYVENYSLWNDVKILLRTAAAMGRVAR